MLTGFPCRIQDSPPTETDGPPGAVAIAAAAVKLGLGAAIATDDCNADVTRAVSAAIGLKDGSSSFAVHAFPPSASVGASDEARLHELAATYDHTVAIERSGRAGDGGYYTMSGKVMNHLVAPLDPLLTSGCACGGGDASTVTRSSTGIGDGGNEAGMGKVAASVREHIKNGPLIACVTPCDSLITAGVSNWGGWALVAATEALIREGGQGLAAHMPPDLPPGGLLPSEEEERAIACAMIATGARDGISGVCDGSVDGMQLETHLHVLRQMRQALQQAYGA